MPELPEVETIMHALEAAVKGDVIERIEIRQRQFRNILSPDFATDLTGRRIDSFCRIAKYMIMNLSENLSVVWHFGMSGTFRIEAKCPETLQKHDHIIIKTNRSYLIYNDPRRFGMVLPLKTDEIKKHPIFINLGSDPWDKDLTSAYLLHKFQNKRIAIKPALLDQSIICGIGNIYASEILYQARINPKRPCESITAKEAERIILCTRQVLEKAIRAGGSSIHDYKHPDGHIGYFQQSHCVYNKKGLRCPQCRCALSKTGGIQKIEQSGRSTFYCATLQQ